MGRKKIQIKYIEDAAKRRVTQCKRKGGLYKKANEYSLLCGLQVAVVIMDADNKIKECYASSDNMKEILEGRVLHYGLPEK
tara:strand:- start:161 stop:403 length:243 start_codon:yes stop_codon:yes gene_type:complete